MLLLPSTQHICDQSTQIFALKFIAYGFFAENNNVFKDKTGALVKTFCHFLQTFHSSADTRYPAALPSRPRLLRDCFSTIHPDLHLDARRRRASGRSS